MKHRVSPTGSSYCHLFAAAQLRTEGPDNFSPRTTDMGEDL
jgi:hypothetical protein